ncbi:MAG TPA: hypothetical protein VMT85_24015 [Thermoanaerobaculia bacterium]|nr:hypothetical protein [Thermoanaerobaculia bacterium]
MSAPVSAAGRRPPRVLYCNCTYAKVVPPEVKSEVLAGLCRSELAFDSVADLCELSARQDPALRRIAEGGEVTIVACYPRAVRWLFHAGRTPLPEQGGEILNMREQGSEEILSRLVQLGGTNQATDR